MPNQYIQVAIPVPMRQLFTYQVPDELQSPTIQVGERIAVPFGNRKVIGIVLSIEDYCDIEEKKLKKVKQRLNDNFHLSKSLVSFLQLCAHYYHHPIGDVFQQALPVNLRKIEKLALTPPMVWHSHETDELLTIEVEQLGKESGKTICFVSINQ